MERFRNKEFNVLVCSNVLEEGIDIQTCNYVLVFDPLLTFNSYIQTKGRARSSESSFVVFCPENEKNATIIKIAKYRDIHDKLKNHLINRTLDFNLNEEFIQKHFIDVIPPLIAPNGAVLLASAAVSHVHRYCQTLPSDLFTNLSPKFEKLPNTANGDFIVTINLPMSSTVKDTITSEPMPDIKLAKASAALKACKRLLENGELNDKFLPVTKKECVINVSKDFFQHWEKYNDNANSEVIGKQNKRIYNRISPDELYNAIPIIGEKCYAYEIILKPDFNDEFDVDNLLPLLNSKANYGLLLKNRLPRLANMPLFMNQGRLMCEISPEPYECRIENEKELELLRNFHVMLFRDIIIKKRHWKSFVAMDRRNKENSFIIVPLSENKINWNLVKKFQRLSSPRPVSVSERKQQIYRPEDFQGSVVSKWYAEDDGQKYLVKNVLQNMNPLSPFDRYDKNCVFKNYVEFYESKYKNKIENIVHKDQFLLEVKPVTSRRNFYISKIGKNYKNKNQAMEILLPEVCHNFEYPNDLCLKAIFLPCILQRVHFMLHAEHIRLRIDNFLLQRTNSVRKPNSVYQPKPLIIDYSLHRNVDLDGNAMEIEEKFPKKILPLEPKTKVSLTNKDFLLDNNTYWNQYKEPVDIDRSLTNIYPLEISYYCHFTYSNDNGDALKTWEENYTKSQLSIPTPKITFNVPKFQVKGSICDATVEDKRFLNILERSFLNISDIIVEQREFVAALTTSGAAEIYDMERFELLGDSFLKFSISLFLVKQFPQWHEGFLTAVKSKFVSNRNLLYCLLQTDIPQRINSKMLEIEEWLPPLLSLPENLLEFVQKRLSRKGIENSSIYGIDLSDEEFETGICSAYKLDELTKFYDQEELNSENCLSLDNDINTYVYKTIRSDKVVADTFEALLGVCVKNYGIHNSFHMLEFFEIIKPDPNIQLSNLLKLNFSSPLLRTNISSKDVDEFLINYKELEKNLGYNFRDRAFLLKALTHPSYPTNRITGNYQELEFIGDAILDFLISCYIFEQNTKMTPGMLTDLRSALVNNITLGCVCERHRFHLFMKYENQALSEAIERFADYQETQNHRITNQLKILLEESDLIDDTSADFAKMNLSETIEVPKALGDVVEALIAAVYFDSRDLKQTWHVIYHLLEQEINEFTDNVPIDPVRALYEKQVDAIFSKAIIKDNAVMISCEFTCLTRKVEVCGFASNSQKAKKAAAKHALHYLHQHSN